MKGKRPREAAPPDEEEEGEDHLDPGLPLATGGAPGVGGVIKAQPADFCVEEIPLYTPSGAGEHVYLTLKREGKSTREVITRLARAFGISDRAIGAAGMKDKRARTTQTLSLHLPTGAVDEIARRAQDAGPWEVVAAARHGNKLRTGHLRGNRFVIRIRDVVPDALERARRKRSELLAAGAPNYFGLQRFGARGDNALRGKRVLLGQERAERWLKRLLLSAYQSELFNRWLAERIQLGLYARLEIGDVARKNDSGGLFLVADVGAEQTRFERFEISHAGPLFGRRMLEPTHAAGERERRMLELEKLSREDFARAGLEGGRRAGRIALGSLELRPAGGHDGAGLEAEFDLPPGAYATTVLRELMEDSLRNPGQAGASKSR